MKIADTKYETIKERGACQITGAVTIIEQFFDHDDDPYFKWTVFIPKKRRAALTNPDYLGGQSQTKKAARASARRALLKHLEMHPQRTE